MSAQRSQLASLLKGKKPAEGGKLTRVIFNQKANHQFGGLLSLGKENTDGKSSTSQAKNSEPRPSVSGGGANVDRQMFGMLTQQEDIPVPGLETYQANKQEMKLFREIEAKYRGALEENQKKVQVEEEREKELLAHLAQIRQDNNEKRKKIDEMTGNVKNSGETVNQRKGVLTSIKNDYNRAVDENKKLKEREAIKFTELQQLKDENEKIMNEIQGMKMDIIEHMKKLDETEQMVKKKEKELQTEREATETLKEILKQSLLGKRLEEIDLEKNLQKPVEEDRPAQVLEEKITLEKFLAIMQAIKNEREVASRYKD